MNPYLNDYRQSYVFCLSLVYLDIDISLVIRYNLIFWWFIFSLTIKILAEVLKSPIYFCFRTIRIVINYICSLYTTCAKINKNKIWKGELRWNRWVIIIFYPHVMGYLNRLCRDFLYDIVESIYAKNVVNFFTVIYINSLFFSFCRSGMIWIVSSIINYQKT